MHKIITFAVAFAVAGTAPLAASWAADMSKGRVAEKDKYDNAEACSKMLAVQDGAALKADQRRRCIIAVASTYVDAEEMSLAFEKQITTDDVSRHLTGMPINRKPGNRAEMIRSQIASSPVILAIRNRKWLVDGNHAWLHYDGFLKAEPDHPKFIVMERITVEAGKITEIFVAGVAEPR